MKRAAGLVAVLVLVAGVAAACGGSDSSSSGDGTTTTAAASGGGSDSGSSSGSSNTGNAKVDAFCNDVDTLVADAKKAVEDKDTSQLQALQDQVQQLGKQGTDLQSEIGAIVRDPSLGGKIADCVGKLGTGASEVAQLALQEAGAGAGGSLPSIPDMTMPGS